MRRFCKAFDTFLLSDTLPFSSPVLFFFYITSLLQKIENCEYDIDRKHNCDIDHEFLIAHIFIFIKPAYIFFIILWNVSS